MSTTKKINRRELEQDEFIEKVFDLGEWLEANWRKAVAAVGGVVLVVVAIVAWKAWSANRLTQANAALAAGLQAFEPQRKADGTATTPRPQEALGSFEKASDLGGSRPVGEVARYYRALALLALDRHADAVPVLEKIGSGDGPIAAQAKVALANALGTKGDYDKASALLQEVASAPAAGFPPDAALAMLGALRARQGRNDEAQKAYQDLLARFPQSAHATDARQRLTELGAPGTLPASSSGTIR